MFPSYATLFVSAFLTSATQWLPEAQALATRRTGDADAAHEVVMDCLLDCEAAIGRRLVPLPPEAARFYYFRALNKRLSRPEPADAPITEDVVAPSPTADASPLVHRMLVAAHDHFPALVYMAFLLRWAGLSSRQVQEQLGISHSIILTYDRRVKAWLCSRFHDEYEEIQPD